MWRQLRKIKIKKKHKQQNGFLLLQISIVLALLLVVMTLSLSHTATFRKQLLRSEIEKLSTLFRYFQQIACVTQIEQRLVFDERNRSYSCGPYKYTLPAGLQFDFFHHSYGPPSNPQIIIQKPVTFKNNTVIFACDGKISSGTIYLTDSEKKSMYALTAPIAHISFLRIYRYDASWICLS